LVARASSIRLVLAFQSCSLFVNANEPMAAHHV